MKSGRYLDLDYARSWPWPRPEGRMVRTRDPGLRAEAGESVCRRRWPPSRRWWFSVDWAEFEAGLGRAEAKKEEEGWAWTILRRRMDLS